MESINKKLWTIDEEQKLLNHYKEFSGNLELIAQRHMRSVRAIDMRITKIIQDLKTKKKDMSMVESLFSGKMSSEEFKNRWNTTSMNTSPKKMGDEFSNLVLKYLTGIDEKCESLEARLLNIEKNVNRILKKMKTTEHDELKK